MKTNNFDSILENDIKIIREISDFLLKIVNPEEIDFQICIKKINKLENDTFSLTNIHDIDLLSNIKKIFLNIDRNKFLFFEFKYDLFSVLSKIEQLYSSYKDIGIKQDNSKIKKIESELIDYDKKFSNDLYIKNKDKTYYYIKITLDTSVPYFYLSRKNILNHLREYGKPYNYIPISLDDDSYNYFILDYKVDNSINVQEIFENLKKIDDAIIKYTLFKVNNENNIYNIKFFINEKINEHSCIMINTLNFIDLIHYKDFYDTYVEAKNQIHIINKLLNLKNENINLILLKKISDRESKIFLPNGITKNNITKIKKIIEYILIDKTISEILYYGNIDFYGLQMLKYLRKRYNTEFSEIVY
ncbi:hypothetical protein [Caviibacter abscessus]|uniref:hypothetical protein n=1 Tax=Caviibacter abscessus TaxID=1766719 RepID=UPI00083471CC|nr:hypothetical protein [Caviibacter abscessus]